MDTDQIIERLRVIMKKTSKAAVDWNTVNGETSIATLGFDSLSILDLIYDIQQEFSLEFEAEQMVGVKTVNQLAEFLRSKGA